MMLLGFIIIVTIAIIINIAFSEVDAFRKTDRSNWPCQNAG